MQNFTWLNNFVRQNFRKAEFNRARKGFTLIELIVVIAIIGILAGIVVAVATGYINKAKIARANVDASNIGKALTLFYTTYGVYPYNDFYDCGPDYCYAIIAPGGGPVQDAEGHKLSEFYNLDLDSSSSANYFAPGTYYYIGLDDWDGDGIIGCGYIWLNSSSGDWYGEKFILCQDCQEYCRDYGDDYPFQTEAYP